MNSSLLLLSFLQARAPNSPVLIVGTHYDLVKEKFPPSWSEDLQQMIRDKFINVIDADKLGLPRVLDTIEVQDKEESMPCDAGWCCPPAVTNLSFCWSFLE